MIDLHEGYDFHQINSKSVGSSIIDAKGKAADIATQNVMAVNATITDPKNSCACVILWTAAWPRGA